MKNSIQKKLRSRRGSGIAEALIGFLISVLSVLILYGIVTTTSDLIRKGDTALWEFYEDESLVDRFNSEGVAFQNSEYAAQHPDQWEMRITYQKDGEEQPYSFAVFGDPDHAPDDKDFDVSSSGIVEGVYFVTDKYHLFAFSSN